MSYKGILRKAGINVDNNTITFDRSKDIVYRLRSSLTTGTIRGVNNTVTMTGRSSANIVEGLRSAITANVKTGAWCNAITGIIDYSTSGAAHGMAASICAEMIPPNSSLERGALYALDCEFGCGASSSWGSAGPVAFIKFENWGTAAHFSANAFLFHLAGETGAAGGLLSENSRTLRVRIGTTTKYLYLSDSEDDLGTMVVDSIVLATAVAIPLLISATVSDTGIDISGTCANFGIDISGGQTAVGIAVSGACGTYGLLMSGACSTAGIGITGAEVIGILIATSTPTIGVSITANCETAAISISGDQVLGTLFHATAAATAAHSVMVPTGITLGAGLDINTTSTGIVTSGLTMQGTGTFTTGITLSATAITTGIAVSAGSMTDGILISGATPVDGIQISSACSAAAINLSGANAVGVLISGANTTAGINITGDQVIGILYDVDAAATDGLKILVDDGITLGTGINIDRTGTTGICTTAISIDTDGTTGIEITAGFTGVTAISLAGTGSTAGISISGDHTTGIVIGTQTTAGITIASTGIGIEMNGTYNNALRLTNALAVSAQTTIRVLDTYSKTDGYHTAVMGASLYVPDGGTGSGAVIGVFGEANIKGICTGTNYSFGVRGTLQLTDDTVLNGGSSIFGAINASMKDDATPTLTAGHVCGIYIDNLIDADLSGITGITAMIYSANNASATCTMDYGWYHYGPKVTNLLGLYDCTVSGCVTASEGAIGTHGTSSVKIAIDIDGTTHYLLASTVPTFA